MSVLMMCTECFHTGEPDTIIEGSDRKELLLWLAGIVPGIVYCYWRHSNRVKVCPRCSSGELIREARAAARKRIAKESLSPATEPTLPRVFVSERPGLLSRLSGVPRNRLAWSRHAGLGFAGSLVVLFAAGVNLIEVRPVVGSIPTEIVVEGSEPDLAQTVTGRARGCWWICDQFHDDNILQTRECVDACIERNPVGDDRRLAVESCNEVMDSSVCEIVVGRS